MLSKILALSGSTRKNSINEYILKVIDKLYPDKLEVTIYNQLDELPYFNPDLVTDEKVISETVKNNRILKITGTPAVMGR